MSASLPPSVQSLAGCPVGFIGLGLMGAPMARRLHAAGARLTVHNRSAAAVDAFAALGHHGAAHAREVATRVESGPMVLMLPNNAAVEAVLHGPDGLLAGLCPGALVIDMGSSGVEETRVWARAVEARGAAWLDAPVSGGVTGATAGQLSIMVGGAVADFERAQPILACLGQTLTHLGPNGAGQSAKLANQIIVAVTLTAIAEAFALGRAAGADLAALRHALLGGFAASKILDQHGQRMIDGNFVPGGRVVNQLKDVAAGMQLARRLHLDLPCLEANVKRWEALVAAGGGDLDHAAIFQLYAPSAPRSS